MVKTDSVALAPTREGMLEKALELLVKLTPEQLAEIMKQLHESEGD